LSFSLEHHFFYLEHLKVGVNDQMSCLGAAKVSTASSTSVIHIILVPCAELAFSKQEQ